MSKNKEIIITGFQFFLTKMIYHFFFFRDKFFCNSRESFVVSGKKIPKRDSKPWIINPKKKNKKADGGNLSQQSFVSEQYLLELEREAFLSLCGERKTLERIQYMLKNGKPLRN